MKGKQFKVKSQAGKRRALTLVTAASPSEEDDSRTGSYERAL
jgi:hypothetical protein